MSGTLSDGAPSQRLRRQERSIADVNATRSEVSQDRLVARIIYRIEAIFRIDAAAETAVTEVPASEMAASKMIAAEMPTTEVITTDVTTPEVTAAKREGGGRERSDSDDSQSEFAKHF